MIKQPMDLTTIEDKLRHNKYSDPWQYCSDMRLMLDNAWVYNKKGSRVHRDATTVSHNIYKHDGPSGLGFDVVTRLTPLISRFLSFGSRRST